MFNFSKIFNQEGFAPVTLLIIILIVSFVGGGYYYQSVYKPKLVKESTANIQKDYKALSGSVDDLLENANEDLVLDYQQIKDYIAKQKESLEKVEKDSKNIASSLSKKQSEVKAYVSLVDEYNNKTNEYVKFLKDGSPLIEKIGTALKDLVEINNTINNAGANLLAVSGHIQAGLSKLDQSIKDFEDIQVSSEYGDLKDSFISILKLNRNLYYDTEKAIQAYNGPAAKSANDTYKKNFAKVYQETLQNVKNLKEKEIEFKDKLEEISDKIDKEYKNLDQKYK